MIIKKITCWIFRSAPLFNALIAILTSAVVTLLAGGNLLSESINYWLLGGVIIAVITIVLLSFLSGIAMEVCSRAMTLNDKNGQIGAETMEDAYVHVIYLRAGKNSMEDEEIFIKSHERKVIISFISIVILIIGLIGISWKGELRQQEKQKSHMTNEIGNALGSIRDNQMRQELVLDSLFIKNNMIMDTLRSIQRKIPKEQHVRPNSKMSINIQGQKNGHD